MIGYLRSGRSIVHLKFRGVAPRRELFMDILKVGVPGLLNTAITNLSVALLTGIAGQLGPFETGDVRWNDWVSAHLLVNGQQHPASSLLREFLGRPVSPQALLDQLRRITPPD